MMQMKRFKRNRKGISTIIAAALIVAMTVIAAVALGSTVLKIPTNQTKPYQLQLSGSASIGANQILLTDVGGDPFNTGTVTIKTYIPDGEFSGYTYTVPNTVSADLLAAAYVSAGSPAPPALSIPIRLQTDTWHQIGTVYGGAYVEYGYTYLTELNSNTFVYNAPVTVGDTLVLNFQDSFGPLVIGGLAAPSIGEQFVAELFSGNQPVASVTITVQP